MFIMLESQTDIFPNYLIRIASKNIMVYLDNECSVTHKFTWKKLIFLKLIANVLAKKILPPSPFYWKYVKGTFEIGSTSK